MHPFWVAIGWAPHERGPKGAANELLPWSRLEPTSHEQVSVDFVVARASAPWTQTRVRCLVIAVYVVWYVAKKKGVIASVG